MRYRVVFKERAMKQLKKMEKKNSDQITSWVAKNLEGCSDPRAKGKALHGNHKDTWSYRVGNYRILARIEDKNLIIMLFEVGDRKRVY